MYLDFGCQASFTTRITNPEAVAMSVGRGASNLDLCKSMIAIHELETFEHIENHTNHEYESVWKIHFFKF